MQESISEIVINCEKHPSQIISHICCLDTCLNALCVKCMKNHNLFHKQENVFPEIEAIEDVREFCCEKLLYLIENYNKELEKIKAINSPKKPDQNLQKLSFYREKMISFINNYFNELEKEYEKKIRFSTHESLNTHIEYFMKMIKNLEDYLDEIKYKCTLETLQHILVSNYQQDFEQLKSKNQDLFHHVTSNKTSLIFDDAKMNHILQEIEKLATFSSNFDINKSNSHTNKLIFDAMRTPVTAPIESSLNSTNKSKSLLSNPDCFLF